MRVGIYARVSTSDQDVTAQLARLRAAPALASATEVYEFVDDGVSGSLDSRPAFDRLREQIQARAVDIVVSSKLDRLGRSAKAVLEFFDLAESRGVRVLLADQAIDTATPAGRLLRTVMAAVAEFEGDLIRERTQHAMDAFKAGLRRTSTGRPVGRPRKVTPDLVDRVRELRGQGLKWREIAIRVHLPTGTVRKALRPSKPSVENSSTSLEHSVTSS